MKMRDGSGELLVRLLLEIAFYTELSNYLVMWRRRPVDTRKYFPLHY